MSRPIVVADLYLNEKTLQERAQTTPIKFQMAVVKFYKHDDDDNAHYDVVQLEDKSDVVNYPKRATFRAGFSDLAAEVSDIVSVLRDALYFVGPTSKQTSLPSTDAVKLAFSNPGASSINKDYIILAEEDVGVGDPIADNDVLLDDCHVSTDAAFTTVDGDKAVMVEIDSADGISIEGFSVLNDATAQGTAASNGSIICEITTAAATDIMKWSDDGGATWTSGVNLTGGSPITLSHGATITFVSKTGHAVGDAWVITVLKDDTFRYSIDGGTTWTPNNPCTLVGAPTTVYSNSGDIVKVYFDAVTGHRIGDLWYIECGGQQTILARQPVAFYLDVYSSGAMKVS